MKHVPWAVRIGGGAAREGHLDNDAGNPLAGKQRPGGETNREVFLHFFGMEITWK